MSTTIPRTRAAGALGALVLALATPVAVQAPALAQPSAPAIVPAMAMKSWKASTTNQGAQRPARRAWKVRCTT